MRRFVAGAAGTLMVAATLMAGAGSTSASAPQLAPKPVVSVSHFQGDTLTLSAVAGPNSTIAVTLKLVVTAGQARHPWVVSGYFHEVDPVLGATHCACIFRTPPVFKGKGAMRTFQETSVVKSSIGSDGLFFIKGFGVSATDTKTGVSGEVGVTAPAPLRR
jgi:hypothetical protein